MTPLFHRLMKRFTLPEHKREPLHDPHGLLDDLSDVHCFDCTGAGVGKLLEELSQKEWDAVKDTGKGVLAKQLLFFPAPNTWIEFMWGRTRCAYFARAESSALSVIGPRIGGGLQAIRIFADRQFMHEDLLTLPELAKQFRKAPAAAQPARSCLYHCQAAFLIINSPHVIDRVKRQAHKGLARRVAKQTALKAHPWHQIKLEIFKPHDIDDGEPHQDRITGRRALHFCRSHIRIKLGRLEHVRSHWRGDPSLGVSRASYRVAR